MRLMVSIVSDDCCSVEGKRAMFGVIEATCTLYLRLRHCQWEPQGPQRHREISR